MLTDNGEDYKIKIKDLPGITVGDRKSWKPARNCAQPSDETVISNKTVNEVEEVAEDGEEEPPADRDSDDSETKQ